MVFSANEQGEVAGAVQQLECRAHLPVREAVQRQVRLKHSTTQLCIYNSDSRNDFQTINQIQYLMTFNITSFTAGP